MMYQLYGIPNCDTIKKARKHLDLLELEYEFINFKKNPPTKELLLRWQEKLGELPINKRSRTYREVKDAYEASSGMDQILLLIEKSSLIKRPLLEKKLKPLMMGYHKDDYERL